MNNHQNIRAING